MNWFSALKFRCSANQALVGVAIYIAAFANLAFFRHLVDTFASNPWGRLHIGSLALFLLCAIILFLLLFSFRSLLKPALVFLLMLSALTAYFMDTYNVIIDSDMLENVISTDSAEAADLLSPKLFVYLLILGFLPSLVLSRIKIRDESLGGAITRQSGTT
jgi:lipid A ethanolaminephosphotransferase